MHTNTLTATDRKLLALINDIGHGRLENLELKNGTVVPTPNTRTIRTYKPTRGSTSKKSGSDAFTLKASQENFLHWLHITGNGVIRTIVIQDGYPVHYETEEALSTI